MPYIKISDEAYNKLKQLSEQTKTGITTIIELLARSIELDEDEDDVILVINPAPPFKIRRPRIMTSKEITEMKKRIEQLERENEKLKTKLEAYTNNPLLNSPCTQTILSILLRHPKELYRAILLDKNIRMTDDEVTTLISCINRLEE